MGRVEGWRSRGLAAHGHVDQGHGIDDAIVQWTIATLPAPGAKVRSWASSTRGFYDQAEKEFTSDTWRQRRNLGEYVRRVTAERPWSTTRDGAEGTPGTSGGAAGRTPTSIRLTGAELRTRPASRCGRTTSSSRTRRSGWKRHADAWLLDDNHR